LEFSDDFGGYWVEVTIEDWAAEVNFGEFSEYATGWYRAIEIGNGTNYLGESGPSNVVIQE
jgi:hypothetical protein